MSDNCYLSIEVAEKDFDTVAGALMPGHGRHVTVYAYSTVFELDSANYAGEQEIKDILAEDPNINMIVRWGAGEGYSPGSAVYSEGQRVEVETNNDGHPVIILYNGSLLLDIEQMKNIAAYLELKAKVETIFKEGADSA